MTSNGQPSWPKRPGRAVMAGRAIGLLITNAIKVGGLYLALKTAAEPAPNALVVGLVAFMMAGAQVSEDTILRLVGRMFGERNVERNVERRDT